MKEKLQRAVESTIAAGYQLESEAYEFLSSISAKDDPSAIMHKALQRMEELEEKPCFICRKVIEEIIQPSEPSKSQKPVEENKEKAKHKFESSITEVGRSFHPYAKEVESDIKILQDPTKNLTSNGTLEEYLGYFKDRFKRMEKLLRQRVDVRSATPITVALKSPPKTKLKLIGMVTEKREVKQQPLITIEDLESSASVLISRKAREDVHKRAQRVLLDQVICMVVVKTRGDLFIAEDIIFPEVGQRIRHRAPEPIYAVLTSDIHIGSNKFNVDAFNRFVLWLKGEYGNERMRNIAGHVKYLLVAGDLVDGVGIYPNQEDELCIRDVHKQYQYAIKMLEKLPDYIDIIIAPGNHDAPRKSLPQPAISEAYMDINVKSRNIYSVGNPCRVSLHGVEVLMSHGRSLDDIIGAIPGIDHEHPENAMKLLLQDRHLAPIYGGKTMLAPESRDFLVIDHIPDIFHAGHIHVVGCCNYRGVLVVNSGGWQDQTDYMAKLGLVPTPGVVPVVNLQNMNTFMMPFL